MFMIMKALRLSTFVIDSRLTLFCQFPHPKQLHGITSFMKTMAFPVIYQWRYSGSGSSYTGFSPLPAFIRYPHVYRCSLWRQFR